MNFKTCNLSCFRSTKPNQENPILFDQFRNFDTNFYKINNTFVWNWYVFGYVDFFLVFLFCGSFIRFQSCPLMFDCLRSVDFSNWKSLKLQFFSSAEVDWNVDGTWHSDSFTIDCYNFYLSTFLWIEENQTIEFLSIAAKPTNNESYLHRFMHVRTGLN